MTKRRPSPPVEYFCSSCGRTFRLHILYLTHKCRRNR